MVIINTPEESVSSTIDWISLGLLRPKQKQFQSRGHIKLSNMGLIRILELVFEDKTVKIFFRIKEHQSTLLRAAGDRQAQVKHNSASPEITHKRTENGIFKGKIVNTELWWEILQNQISQSTESLTAHFSTRNAKEFLLCFNDLMCLLTHYMSMHTRLSTHQCVCPWRLEVLESLERELQVVVVATHHGC